MREPGIESSAAFASLAEKLRQQFDDSFTRPAEVQDRGVERLAVVRAGSVSVAVRLNELAGIQVLPAVIELPGDVPFRLGISGIGGRAVPVFDLAGILGCGVPDACLRIVLIHGDDRVGLACHELVGQLDLSANQIHPIGPGDETGSFAAATVSTDGGGIPVLCLRRVVDRIRPGNTRPEER